MTDSYSILPQIVAFVVFCRGLYLYLLRLILRLKFEINRNKTDIIQTCIQCVFNIYIKTSNVDIHSHYVDMSHMSHMSHMSILIKALCLIANILSISGK